MSKSVFDKIAEGLREALAITAGIAVPAQPHSNEIGRFTAPQRMTGPDLCDGATAHQTGAGG